MLSVRQLKKALNRVPVLKGVDLDVAPGEQVVIIGRSGGGKSVLLRHLIGLLQPDSGEVCYKGVNLSTLSEEDLNPHRREIGMLFQNGALFDSLSVEENLSFPLRERGGFTPGEVRRRVDEALEIVDLPRQNKKLPAELSGGMRKRVALARAVIGRPELMLYDEPTTGLDPIVANSINKLILRLGQQLKMASIVVTHDMTSAFMIADRVCFLYEGAIRFQGTVEQVKASADDELQRFVNGISKDEDAVL
ncbi:MAG: ATP-binding cassette domain-containing protein [Candidatus Methylacidiphilales bacterium]|nr:ATP-binding cassette domain-containing protein [Candidatus Methylacidiphilales bacterium]